MASSLMHFFLPNYINSCQIIFELTSFFPIVFFVNDINKMFTHAHICLSENIVILLMIFKIKYKVLILAKRPYVISCDITL